MAGSERLRVGVIMGSDSDMGTMREATRALREVGGLEPTVGYEAGVVSAHRTPKLMGDYAKQAAGRGVDVIIAGAGGSAHLPGMVASETGLPVLGVAVTSSPEDMNRALGALIGMPDGKPLVTFQTGKGAYQAGVLASRILALEGSANKVGIVASAEQDRDTMGHVGRALSMLGLRETVDYDYLLPEDMDLARGAEWAKHNHLAVLVGSTNNQESRFIHDMNSAVDVPVLGVAAIDKKQADKMSPALSSLVNSEVPVAASQTVTGAFNAGLMAARILALHNPTLRGSIVDYNQSLVADNLAKNTIMGRIGDVAYDALKEDEVAFQAALAAEIEAQRA